MGFRQAACHVWAIDGYEDDDRMARVNTAYTEASPESVENNKGWRSATVERAVVTVRARLRPALTDRPCTIYGGFRRGQKLPEHMWLEYNGYIFETMPGHDLVFEQANNRNRDTPRLEGDPFANANVGFCISVLTESQLAMINAAT
ncbi:hypothetical protein LMG27952_02635 [Paraburkholderia hiiakae]|uniref:Uncharacterized protein n=1 Tax=Paraburkholderia hiiakae TaxID=1081782 RepID=A0ABN7HRX8_9BURK|nr:hypothetical protein [Paraburkholderia hiiakae]CAD6531910.1 hypothetical protein LMG27952_02635 [Paraburkholderia hiiakae]